MEQELQERARVGGQSADNRTALLASMIRSCRGQVLWWPVQDSPHPSAARMRFECDYENEVTGQRGTHGLTGWGLAVPSVADLIELAQTHRQGTLIDLETGRWARVLGTPHGPGVERVTAEAQTVDALGRSRNAGLPTGLVQLPRYPRVGADTFQPWAVTAPADQRWPAGTSGRWRSEPLFDSEVISGPLATHQRQGRGPNEVRLFGNCSQYMWQPAEDAAQAKSWGTDTNLSGSGGGMPQGYYAHVYGLSVELFYASSRLPLSPEDAAAVCAGSGVTLELGQTRLAAVPLEHAVVTPFSSWAGEAEHAGVVTVPHQSVPMYPFAFPIPIEALQNFGVALMNAQGFPREPRTIARAVLHAHVAKGIVG